MRGGFTLFLLFITVTIFGQNVRKFVREGNKQYDNKNYTEAETNYRKAIDKNSHSFEAAFNIGDALYKQGKYPEAAKQFGDLTQIVKDKDNLNRLYYNQGNAYLKNKKLTESIDAYKKALKLLPNDQNSKSNLAYAQKLLKKQQDQKNKDQKNKDKNNDKDKDKKKDQDKKKDNNKDQNKDKNKDKDKDDKDKGKDQDKDNENQQNQKSQISPDDAQRLLDAIQNDEKELQKKLNSQKAQLGQKKLLKNW